MENLRHEKIFGVLVSHGSSIVPKYIVDEINSLGGDISNAHGIRIDQLIEVINYGICKINIDTDIRLAVTRNIREFFLKNTAKQKSSSIGAIWQHMQNYPQHFDPREYLTSIMDALLTGNVMDDDTASIIEMMARGVREIVGTMIVNFGSVGYAPKIECVTLEQMANRYKREEK